MRSGTSKPVQPLSNAPARTLISAIEALAARNTNAVLELIGDPARIETNRHYPAQDLRFGGARLRAYYHCHEYAGRDSDEHGHFHLFALPRGVADDKDNWVHLAALSMDRDGQPLAWLALNRWVAGGPWLDAAPMAGVFPDVSRSNTLSAAENYLSALLELHQSELVQLLHERDRFVHTILNADVKTVIDDRRHYVLARTPIALLAKLQQSLQ